MVVLRARAISLESLGIEVDIILGYFKILSELRIHTRLSDLNVTAPSRCVLRGFDKGSSGCYLRQIAAIRAFDFK